MVLDKIKEKIVNNPKIEGEIRAMKAVFLRGDLKFRYGRDKPSEQAKGLDQLKDLSTIESELKIRETWSVIGRPSEVLPNKKQLNALQTLDKAMIQKYYKLPSDQGRTQILEDITAKRGQIGDLGPGSETDISALKKDISNLKLLFIVPNLVEEREINDDQINKLQNKMGEVDDLRKAVIGLETEIDEQRKILSQKELLKYLKEYNWQNHQKSNDFIKRTELILRANKLDKKFTDSVERRQKRVDEIKSLFGDNNNQSTEELIVI